jgi:hypothetical protein
MPRGVPSAKPAEAEVVEVVEAEAAEAAEVEEPDAGATPGRRETFEATRPDGTVVVVDRNIDTGEQTVTEK